MGSKGLWSWLFIFPFPGNSCFWGTACSWDWDTLWKQEWNGQLQFHNLSYLRKCSYSLEVSSNVILWACSFLTHKKYQESPHVCWFQHNFIDSDLVGFGLYRNLSTVQNWRNIYSMKHKMVQCSQECSLLTFLFRLPSNITSKLNERATNKSVATILPKKNLKNAIL